MKKRTADVGFRCHHCIKCFVAKQSMQLPPQIALATSQPIFEVKIPHCRPRAGFRRRTKTQTPLMAHSGTFNGGNGIKTIRQPSYLRNTATADFFCFREANLKLADLLMSKRGLITDIEGVVPTRSKNESATAFWRWMNHCKQYIRSALTGPKKVLK
jgi:hypothetical protein